MRLPEVYQLAAQMAIATVAELDASLCGECGSRLDGTEPLLCGDVNGDRTTLTLRFLGPECSAAHDPEWVERVPAVAVNHRAARPN